MWGGGSGGWGGGCTHICLHLLHLPGDARLIGAHQPLLQERDEHRIANVRASEVDADTVMIKAAQRFVAVVAQPR